jgi:predicted O-linked N-acetylglucosamine transferase (SPINDLY family)
MPSDPIATQPPQPNRANAGAEEPLAELARSLFLAGDVEGATEAYEQALALAPHRSDLYVELGNAWQELNDPEAAVACYRRAVETEPGNVPARQNLGYLLGNLGDSEGALREYEQLLRIWPSPISRMLSATVLPVIYDTSADVQAWRQRLTRLLREIADSGVRIDTTRSQIPTSFLLAYQGENDREIAREFGRIYQGRDLCQPRLPVPQPGEAPHRLRIGFLSAFFRDHTIGRLNLGAVRHMSRDKFEVSVLSAGTAHDDWTETFAAAADHFLTIPRNVELARQSIAEQQLDVLIFSDVGMDAVTSTLVFSRMAPVQCVTWGHPDTTGSPAIDFFLSSALMELSQADDHYTEKLIRLPQTGVYYHRPAFPEEPRTREWFGLRPQNHLYVCPQTLYKFHPDFDEVLAAILTADPLGEIVLLDGRVRNWTERLRQRFARTLPEAGRRVRFLAAQPYDDFLSLLTIADVILDPLHFGGGNSSFEALAMGAPIVTLPSQYLRGRITLGLYTKIDFTELVVSSADEYVHTAVRLATDPEFNRAARRRISESNSMLFEDREEIRALEAFLSSLFWK